MFYYGTLYKDILIASSTGDYASINELICLANMENINAVLIDERVPQGINAVLIDERVPQGERLVRLNQIAINQMRVLENDDNRNLLKFLFLYFFSLKNCFSNKFCNFTPDKYY